MKVNLWGDLPTQVLQKGLDAATLRQEVISNNVANVNTPGFKRSNVTFEEGLKKALAGRENNYQRTSLLEDTSPEAVKDNRTSMRNDLNNVDMEIEMLNLSSNQIKYNGLIQLLNDRYSNLRYVINEGRR